MTTKTRPTGNILEDVADEIMIILGAAEAPMTAPDIYGRSEIARDLLEVIHALNRLRDRDEIATVWPTTGIAHHYTHRNTRAPTNNNPHTPE